MALLLLFQEVNNYHTIPFPPFFIHIGKTNLNFLAELFACLKSLNKVSY